MNWPICCALNISRVCLKVRQHLLVAPKTVVVDSSSTVTPAPSPSLSPRAHNNIPNNFHNFDQIFFCSERKLKCQVEKILQIDTFLETPKESQRCSLKTTIIKYIIYFMELFDTNNITLMSTSHLDFQMQLSLSYTNKRCEKNFWDIKFHSCKKTRPMKI